MKKNKNAEILTQTFFFILVLIFFVGILWFGFSKLLFVEDVLSKKERIDFKKEITKELKFCEDSLNSGSIRNIKLKSKKFNGLCFLGRDIHTTSEYKNFLELKDLYDVNKTAVLVKTSIIKKDSENFSIKDLQVVDAFENNLDRDKSFCWLDFKNKGEIEISFNC